MNVKHVSYLLPAALVLGSAAYAQAPKGRAVPPSYVQVEKVTTGQDRVMRKSIGYAEAIRSVQVKAAVEGFLDEVLFEEGSIVKEGDVIMRIHAVRYEAALRQKEAAVRELDAQIIYAQNRYNRLTELSKQFAASKQDTETALAKLEGLKAKRSGAQADVVKARKDLDDCTIRAEVTGRIGRLSLSVGNYVTKGEQLAYITQIDPMYVRFPLSQHDVDAIFGGQKDIGNTADIKIKTTDGLRYPSDGRIAIVGNLLTGNTDTYSLWATFENPEHKLVHQGGAAVFVTKADEAEVAQVPLTAVHHDAQGDFVYVLDDKNTVSRREVTSGSIQGRMQTIYSGLQAGETVITDGSHKVRIGATVIPVFPDQKKGESKKESSTEEAPLAVATAEVTEMSDPTVITCQGARLEPINRVQLRPLVQGLLQEQCFKEGDTVGRGDVLFRIDPTRYQAEVDVCKSTLAQLKVSIEDAEAKYKRQEQLVTLNASSRDDLENAKATLDELLAQRDSAEAALVIAEDDLSRCVIHAGLPGARIGRVTFSEGTYISDVKSPLATIVQVSPIYVRFPMSETSILSTFGNDERFVREADITLQTASGTTFAEKGRVSFCDNVVQLGTNTQNVWATFENADGSLTPGGVVTVRITRKPEFKVAAVPADAVLTDTAGHYVFAAEDGHAVRRDIITGGTAEDGRTAVFHGLKPGDRVITSNLAELEGGEAVTTEQK